MAAHRVEATEWMLESTGVGGLHERGGDGHDGDKSTVQGGRTDEGGLSEEV